MVEELNCFPFFYSKFIHNVYNTYNRTVSSLGYSVFQEGNTV